MANGTWKRTTTEERRKQRQVRYRHIAVQVAVVGGRPMQTSKGDGLTYRAAPKPDREQRKAIKRMIRTQNRLEQLNAMRANAQQ